MNANKIAFFFLSLVALLVLGVFPIPEASAQNLSSYSFGGEWINNWSNCSCSGLSTLAYCDDQITQLDDVLYSAGLTRKFRLSQSNVKADHMIEDYSFEGNDHNYADSVSLYAFSGHGALFNNNNQTVYGPYFCSRGTTNYSPNVAPSCVPEADQMRFGETSAISGYGTRTGKLQWLIMATCYSVDSCSQWARAFSYGMDMVLGYKGPSTDGETTDENLADFAEDSIEDTDAFKAAWFYANEDWYVDDTASLTTCTSNTSTNTATYRLNNYNRTWTPRKHNGSSKTCAYSYHVG